MKTVRILILRALKLGDFLTAVPAFRAIRQAYPRGWIMLAAPRELRPLVEMLDGAIDELIPVREYAALPAEAAADVGINLHGCGPESHRILLAAHPRRLIAFRHPAIAQSATGAEYDPNEHEVARWCRLLTHAGIAADPADLDVDASSLAIPDADRGATLIHPGAASEARRWPAERWAAVGRLEQRAGHRVVFTGGRDERERAQAIAYAAGVPPSHVYAGRTNLRELAALVAGAARVICGDTGIAHLATAFRRPSVLLFGPTPPRLWGPPQRPYHRVLWAGTTGNPHAGTVDPGLRAISVEHVINALEHLPD